MKLSDGGDLKAHFLEFDKTIRDLKAIGSKLEELGIVCHLFMTLPKVYDNVVTALETIEPDKLTLDFVKSRLLDEYGKRQGNAGKLSDSVAMYTLHK